MDLKDKVAIVTGAAQGIGKVIALGLAKCGADIAVSDITEDGLNSAVQEIEALGRKAIAVKMDVSSLKDCEDMVKKTIDAFGKVDILINNAGITRDTVLLRMKEEQWDQVIQVNLK